MELAKQIDNAALAFRGYNVANLGRSAELLANAKYRPVILPYLVEASRVWAESSGREVDLVRRIDSAKETTLEEYAESIAIVMAIEQAQLRLLGEFHDIDFHQSKLSFGFSLGEIAALVAGGCFKLTDALRVPLSMAADSIELARDVTLGILFTRRDELLVDRVEHVLLEINNTGQGVIGISTYLSPNSVLVMGTGTTLEQLKKRLPDIATTGIHLRRNEHRWPPLHTPIVWEKDMTTRAARMLHTLPGGFVAPHPEVLSLVTGRTSYDDFNVREHMIHWIDHTQRLWDVVCEVLGLGIETILHVGPAPNIIPATFNRLAIDVEAQTKGSRGMRALSAVINRPWLSSMLPRRAALLRAPQIKQVILEDWLLEHAP